MKETPHTARFKVTRTYSNRYHGEAEKRNHGKWRFTDSTGDVGCNSLQKKSVLKPVTGYSKTITFHRFYKLCEIMDCVYLWGYQYIYTYKRRFLRHVEITLISKCFILPRLIMDFVMADSVLLLKHSIIIIIIM